MKKGTILFHPRFKFKDGEIGEKLLIILNTPENNNIPLLVCKTTSIEKYGITNQGCHSQSNIYYIDADFDFFKKNTWIQFHEIYELNKVSLLNEHFNNCLEIVLAP